MSKYQERETTGMLLNYSYHQNDHKFVSIDLLRHTSTSIPQEISSIGKLEENDGATTFFILEK